MDLEKTLDDWDYPNSPCDICHPSEPNKVTGLVMDSCPGEENCPLYTAWKERRLKDIENHSKTVHKRNKMVTKDREVIVKYICSPCGYLFRTMKNVPVPESVICPDCGKELHGTRQTNEFANITNKSYLWFEYR